jgi:hypothetical protein
VTQSVKGEPIVVTRYLAWENELPSTNTAPDASSWTEIGETRIVDTGAMLDMKPAFYLVIAKDDLGQLSNYSNETGKFTYKLTTGGPAQSASTGEDGSGGGS